MGKAAQDMAHVEQPPAKLFAEDGFGMPRQDESFGGLPSLPHFAWKVKRCIYLHDERAVADGFLDHKPAMKDWTTRASKYRGFLEDALVIWRREFWRTIYSQRKLTPTTAATITSLLQPLDGWWRRSKEGGRA